MKWRLLRRYRKRKTCEGLRNGRGCQHCQGEAKRKSKGGRKLRNRSPLHKCYLWVPTGNKIIVISCLLSQLRFAFQASSCFHTDPLLHITLRTWFLFRLVQDIIVLHICPYMCCWHTWSTETSISLCKAFGCTNHRKGREADDMWRASCQAASWSILKWVTS